MKVLKWLAGIIICLLLLLLAAAFWLTHTTSGLTFVLRSTTPILKKHDITLRYTGLRGTVGHMELAEFSLQSPQFIINAQDLNIAWAPFYLLTHRIDIRHLTAQSLTVQLLKSTPATAPKPAKKPVAAKKPHTRWHINLDRLAINRFKMLTSAGDISGYAHFNQQRQTWRILLNGQQLDLQNFNEHLPAAADFKLDSSSDGKTQQTQLSFNSKTISVNLAGTGKRHTNEWLDTIHTLTTHSPLGDWAIQQPAQLTIGNNGITLQQACLYHKAARICLSGNYSSKGWQLNAVSNTLNLGDFEQPQQFVALSGSGQFALHLQSDSKYLNGSFTTDWHNITAKPSGEDSVFQHVNYLQIQQFHWHFTMQTHQFNSQLALTFNPTNKLTWHLALEHWRERQHIAITAIMHSTLSADFNNLGVFDYIIPYVDELKGQLHGQLTTNGPVLKPDNSGSLTLSNAQIALPLLGITLKDVQLAVTNPVAHQLYLQGSMRSNGGALDIVGSISPPFKTPTINLDVGSKNFTLIDLPVAKVVASAKLHYQSSPQVSNLTGNVTIPEASINADRLKDNVQGNSDIVFINDKGQVLNPHHSVPFNTKINVILGNNVIFTGFGVKTYITGNLAINGTAGQTTTATGRLKLVNGSYHIYGKVFNVNDTSYIIFANSPISNPSLDVTAIYQLSTVPSASTSFDRLQTGVHVHGTVKDPRVTLFSNPSLSQEDILSYIVLGQPLQDVQQGSKAPLAQAALVLAERGGGKNVLQSIQNFLGINEISVGSLSDSSAPQSEDSQTDTDNAPNTDNTAVFIGKSLGSRLRIGYGIGLFNQEQEVTSTLILNRYLTLHADTGDNYSGADLVFTINH